MLRQIASGQSNTVVRLKTRSLHLRNRLRSSVVTEYPPADTPLAEMELLMPRVDCVIEEANKFSATQGGVVCVPRLPYLTSRDKLWWMFLRQQACYKKALLFSKILELLEPEVGGQITSIPQANGSSGDVGPLHLLQRPFQKLPQPLERLLKNLPIVDWLEVVKLFDSLESVLKIRLGQVLD